MTVHRPPPNKTNKFTVDTFIEEFSSLVEILTLSRQPLIICGDFNFHVDDLTNPDAAKFLNFLESTDLKYNVTAPTHRQGHSLDLILSREDENIVSDIRILPSDNISVHSLITGILDCSRPPPSKLLVKHRNMKNLNMNRFVEEIKSSKLFTNPESNICNLITQYNDTLSSLLEKHAPEKQRLVTLRPNSP